MRTWILLFIALGLLLAGCTSSGSISPAANSTIAASAPAAPSNSTIQAAPAADPIVEFDTTKGNFTAIIYVNEAPITGGNFMKLVNEGFYNNLTFHRVVPGFVAQGGDPRGDGTGGSGTTIPLEINANLTHKYGALAMARASDPNSASSQFYICLNAAACAQLDGQYAVFGQVEGDGMNVVNQFNAGQPPADPDRMIQVFEKTS